VTELGEHAYRRLRDEIVSLGLPPGAEVSEQRLTEDFDLSRASVRAALARLRADGLVTSVPRRGHVVAVLTLRDVHEVFRMRLLLEPEAAALAAGNIGVAELAALDGACAKRYDPADKDSVTGFLAANRELHLRVAAASGNGRLARSIAALLSEAERASHLALSAGAGEGGIRIFHEHAELIEALVRPDPEAARTLMHTAIASFHEELTATLLATDAVQSAAL
jgi:DNA-binding GntR family transcriptional regulator